ncbi:hypothetical protein KUTeg_018653 [Tegillarca granosa]|uniref:Uncharacterized protein n=1 Tax=Tegillarca granosa TaxID=220873 RepID=A0ABQ9EJM8_TEGGR|nr:hypothetical protein KUTeg_018653 [Tegillarca granosa]
MLIANAHILPQRHRDYDDVSQGKSGSGEISTNKPPPPPIIVKFVCLRDRDFVLSKGYLLKGTNIRLVTDLPGVLKQQRKQLLQTAYRLRKDGKATATRVREPGPQYFSRVQGYQRHSHMENI